MKSAIKKPISVYFDQYTLFSKLRLYICIEYTVKPALKTTSEQRPPVNNDQSESPAPINLL